MPRRDWAVSRQRGPAAALVASTDAASPPRGRLVQVCDVETAGFVLGSTQPAGHVDPARAAAAGVEVCRRRSGGGGVLVLPAALLWLDVFVPAGDPLWHDDVGRSFAWLGAALAAGVASATGAEVRVHAGGLETTAWSRWLCFAGLGPGEAWIAGTGEPSGEPPRKFLGLSQRRDRSGAWLRAMVLLRHDPRRSAGLLALDAAGRRAAEIELGRRAAAVAADPVLLEAALLEAVTAC